MGQVKIQQTQKKPQFYKPHQNKNLQKREHSTVVSESLKSYDRFVFDL